MISPTTTHTFHVQKSTALRGACRTRCSPHREKNLLDEKNTSSQPEFITKKKKESGFLQYYILYIAVARAELPEKLPMDFKPIFSRLT